jgi:transcriptional regulator with XRE-family HTH domain
MGIPINKIIKDLPAKQQWRIKEMAAEEIKEYQTLQELRKALGFTQSNVADLQGVRQVNISNLEKRSDMHISTLKKYVEALGCELEINIRVPDKSIVKVRNLTQD